eukprot:Lankesteria_metandrocarpae@DN4497_c0_g1_i6.p1
MCADHNFLVENSPFCLVVAHPDDEVMFFTPFLTRLKETQTSNKPAEAHVLCLSNGNYEGLGDRRTIELYESCNSFSIPSTHVKVVSSSKLCDGWHHWEAEDVAAEISKYVTVNKIRTVVTFDCTGVSGHPNHISCWSGCRLLSVKRVKRGRALDCSFFELQSVGLLRKYLGVFEQAAAILVNLFGGSHATKTVPRKGEFYSYQNDILASVRGLRHHRSQWIWYRVFFAIFSRQAGSRCRVIFLTSICLQVQLHQRI